MAVITYDSTGAGRSLVRAQSSRAQKIVTGKFAFDTSYPTGGESISDIADQFAEMLGCLFEPTGGMVFEVDYTANAEKVKAFFYDYNAAADGVAIERAAATDLSALTAVRFIAWGY